MSRARTFADLATASEEGSLASPNLLMNGDMAIYIHVFDIRVGHSGGSGALCDEQFHFISPIVRVPCCKPQHTHTANGASSRYLNCYMIHQAILPPCVPWASSQSTQSMRVTYTYNVIRSCSTCTYVHLTCWNCKPL